VSKVKKNAFTPITAVAFSCVVISILRYVFLATVYTTDSKKYQSDNYMLHVDEMRHHLTH